MDESLTAHAWLLDWMAPSLRIGIPFTLESWSNIREHFPQCHSADTAAVVGDVFIPDIEGWLLRFSRRPWTFIHQDYELDNMLFRADGPVIVDWQTAMMSFPGVDLGWLLMASHNEETLAREPELLDHYRAELAAAGGPLLERRGSGRRLGLGRVLLGIGLARAVHALGGGRRAGPVPSPLQGHDARHDRRG